MQKTESRRSTAEESRTTRPAVESSEPTPADARTAANGEPSEAAGDGRANSGVRPALRLATDAFTEERDDVLSVINELEDQLDRYEAVRETLEREQRETSEQLQASRQRVQELEWQLVTLQTRVDALEQVRQEISLLEEEIADANTRAQRLTEQLGQTQQDNARLGGELRSANKQLEELWAIRKERDGLRNEQKTLRTRADQLETSVRDLQQERTTLAAKFEETRAAFEEARTARHQVELRLRAAEDANEELRKSLETGERRIESLQTENRNLQAQFTHLEREKARMVEQQQYYECELASLRNANRNAELALSNIKKAFGEVRAALSETRIRTRRRNTAETWSRATTATLRGLGVSTTDIGATQTDATHAAAATAATGSEQDDDPA